MATLVLQAAGAAVGSLFGPFGAAAGRALGALAGYAVDSALFGESRTREGSRLADLEPQTSREGAAIPRVYGRVRISGQVIWATRFEEVASDSRDSGGKGGASGTTTRTYSYYANFAVGLCEGPVARIGRVWADGKPFDLSTCTCRFYSGDEAQDVDSLIAAKQGAAPAYRGTAMIVFERLALEDFGNRIPQLSFEVIRPVDGVERDISAVTLIPGSTEFGYDPEPVLEGDLARQPRGAQPPCRWGNERLAGFARRIAGGLPQPRARGAGGDLVRRRSPRRHLHADAGGRRPRRR